MMELRVYSLAVLEPEAWREAGREQPASQISTSLPSLLRLPLPPCLSVSFLLSLSSYFPSFFLPPSFPLFLFPSLPSSLLLPISSSPFPSPTPTILLPPSLSFHRHYRAFPVPSSPTEFSPRPPPPAVPTPTPLADRRGMNEGGPGVAGCSHAQDSRVTPAGEGFSSITQRKLQKDQQPAAEGTEGRERMRRGQTRAPRCAGCCFFILELPPSPLLPRCWGTKKRDATFSPLLQRSSAWLRDAG